MHSWGWAGGMLATHLHGWVCVCMMRMQPSYIRNAMKLKPFSKVFEVQCDRTGLGGAWHRAQCTHTRMRGW